MACYSPVITIAFDPSLYYEKVNYVKILPDGSKEAKYVTRGEAFKVFAQASKRVYIFPFQCPLVKMHRPYIFLEEAGQENVWYSQQKRLYPFLPQDPCPMTLHILYEQNNLPDWSTDHVCRLGKLSVGNVQPSTRDELELELEPELRFDSYWSTLMTAAKFQARLRYGICYGCNTLRDCLYICTSCGLLFCSYECTFSRYHKVACGLFTVLDFPQMCVRESETQKAIQCFPLPPRRNKHYSTMNSFLDTFIRSRGKRMVRVGMQQDERYGRLDSLSRLAYGEQMLMCILTGSNQKKDRVFVTDQLVFQQVVARKHRLGVHCICKMNSHILHYDGVGLLLFNNYAGSMVALCLLLENHTCAVCDAGFNSLERVMKAGYCYGCNRVFCDACIHDCKMKKWKKCRVCK